MFVLIWNSFFMQNPNMAKKTWILKIFEKCWSILTSRLHWTSMFRGLRGYCTSNQKLECFVLYLKIINTFWKMIYASYSKFSKELKTGIKILVDQAVFKLWIKTVKMMCGSITREPLGLPKFWCYFWVPWTIYYEMHIYYFSKKVLVILR